MLAISTLLIGFALAEDTAQAPPGDTACARDKESCSRSVTCKYSLQQAQDGDFESCARKDSCARVFKCTNDEKRKNGEDAIDTTCFDAHVECHREDGCIRAVEGYPPLGEYHSRCTTKNCVKAATKVMKCMVGDAPGGDETGVMPCADEYEFCALRSGCSWALQLAQNDDLFNSCAENSACARLFKCINDEKKKNGEDAKDTRCYDARVECNHDLTCVYALEGYNPNDSAASQRCATNLNCEKWMRCMEGGGEASGGESPSGESPSGESPSGELPGGESASGESSGVDAPGGDAPSGESSGVEAPGGEAPGGEASGGESSGVDAPGVEAPGGAALGIDELDLCDNEDNEENKTACKTCMPKAMKCLADEECFKISECLTDETCKKLDGADCDKNAACKDLHQCSLNEGYKHKALEKYLSTRNGKSDNKPIIIAVVPAVLVVVGLLAVGIYMCKCKQ